MSRMQPVTVQLNETERKRLTDEASAMGLSLSAYLRSRLTTQQIVFPTTSWESGSNWSASVTAGDGRTWTYNAGAANTSAVERRETK